MKKAHLIILCLLSSLAIAAQDITEKAAMNEYFPEPTIDRRIEILSIVFRLAGAPEYSSNVYGSYARDIYTYFDEYLDHPVISFASELREENGVAFDAVMKMAYHIDQAPMFTPKVKFSEEIPERRWGFENAEKFLELLRDFYGVSDFESFYKEHTGLYEIALERFSSVYEAIHIEWFNNYYGEKPGSNYHVVISLGNGGSSYGGKLIYSDGREEAYTILGTWVIDSTDLPVYTRDSYLETLIHEFNHSYVNPLIDKYETQLEASGEIIFEPLQESFSFQAYGEWQIMMYESLVRASVIRYLLKYDSYDAAKKRLIADTGRGFYWMRDLVNLLSVYEANRDQYETMDSYMPEVVKFFDKIAMDSEAMFEMKQSMQ